MIRFFSQKCHFSTLKGRFPLPRGTLYPKDERPVGHFVVLVLQGDINCVGSLPDGGWAVVAAVDMAAEGVAYFSHTQGVIQF